MTKTRERSSDALLSPEEAFYVEGSKNRGHINVHQIFAWYCFGVFFAVLKIDD